MSCAATTAFGARSATSAAGTAAASIRFPLGLETRFEQCRTYGSEEQRRRTIGYRLPVSTVALDVAAVRARFSALSRELVFFDGPGGSQVPDEVIDAIATYLRESNANVSGPYETSRRTEVMVDEARQAGGTFLG